MNMGGYYSVTITTKQASNGQQQSSSYKKVLVILFCFVWPKGVNCVDVDDPGIPFVEGLWNGRWFPDRRISTFHSDMANAAHENHLYEMNTIEPECDDGETSIGKDMPHSYSHFVCAGQYLEPVTNEGTLLTARIPKFYVPRHVCMNESIEYTTKPPLFGPHRRIWATWGEYKYLPQERWVHNLEHGGVVMLYHPCAQRFFVDILKSLVRSCLFRHIITPYKDLPLDQPLALITWGTGYFMPAIDEKEVVRFIKERALKGPEDIYKNGKYNNGLIKPAMTVSDQFDSKLCPNFV